jgi:hypothetical protein
MIQFQIVSNRKTCECGKRCYPSERDANAGLSECRAKGRSERRHYHCHMCGCWHLTSKQYMPKAA